MLISQSVKMVKAAWNKNRFFLVRDISPDNKIVFRKQVVSLCKLTNMIASLIKRIQIDSRGPNHPAGYDQLLL